MKKHLILIVNIILVLAILGGLFYAIYKASFFSDSTDNETVAESVATFDEPTQPPEVYDIGIIQRSDVENCNNIYQGFIAQLASNGYVNQNNINLDYRLIENSKKCKEAIQGFIDEKYDLIFSIGPFATKLAASMTDEIPIVFAGIEEPEQLDFIKSNEAPGGNVTGVSDYTPCFEQIDSIKLLFPDTEKIGAVYLATDASSVTQALIGEKEAQTENVDIPYVKYPVKDLDELKDSFDTMLDNGVDVIYAPIDKFITKNIDELVDFSYENKVPIICGDTDMLAEGCFSTCVISYPSIGVAAGTLVLDILYGDAEPATTPITYIYECYLHINEEAMEELDIELSDEVMAEAIME